jgi:chromosome segregation ATPase
MASKKQIDIVKPETLEGGVLLVDQSNEIQQLKNTLVEKEKEVQSAQQSLKQIIKERDEKTQQIFDRDKEINRLKEDITAKAREVEVQLGNKIKELEVQLGLKLKQYEQVSNKFNDLAKLFDEYIKGSEDMVELQQMLLRNNLRTQELLQIKIKAFNGEGDKKQ